MGSPEQNRNRQAAPEANRDWRPSQITTQDHFQRDRGHHDRGEYPVPPAGRRRVPYGRFGPQRRRSIPHGFSVEIPRWRRDSRTTKPDLTLRPGQVWPEGRCAARPVAPHWRSPNRPVGSHPRQSESGTGHPPTLVVVPPAVRQPMPGHRGEDEGSCGSTIITTADARMPMAATAPPKAGHVTQPLPERQNT